MRAGGAADGARARAARSAWLPFVLTVAATALRFTRDLSRAITALVALDSKFKRLLAEEKRRRRTQNGA